MKKKLKELIKKVVGISIMTVMMFSLTGCDKEQVKQPITREDRIVQTSEDAKSLVVYFSWSGSTKDVATKLQEKVNGDIFRIITKKEYSEDYSGVINEASEEMEKNARPELETHIENLDQYDTIYIGYPIWHADMPQPLYSFFDEYDFSGKTIIPFCTHGATGLVDTVDKIKIAEPNANVLNTTGLNALEVRDRDSENSGSAIDDWLEKLKSMK